MRSLPALLAGLLLLITAIPVAAGNFPAKDARYHTYAEMVAEVNDAVADHPAIVRKLIHRAEPPGPRHLAAKISDNVATDENEPEVLFDALHHAREHLTVEQALAVLRWLTDGYGSNSTITRIGQRPRDLHRVHGQPRRRRVRREPERLPGLAQEPPAQLGQLVRGHRPQPQLRLPLGVLRRVVGRDVVEHIPWAGAPSPRPRPG